MKEQNSLRGESIGLESEKMRRRTPDRGFLPLRCASKKRTARKKRKRKNQNYNAWKGMERRAAKKKTII